MHIIEVNVLTGEQVIRDITPDELPTCTELPNEIIGVTTDPVEKLRAFLASNPDVLSVISNYK